MTAPPPVPPRDRDHAGSLLRQARQLAASAADGAHAPLEGTHLALLCGEDAFESGAAFVDAARGLGARVAHLRPLTTASDPALRMLGQLYRAVCCEGMADGQVHELTRLAVLPVLANLASPAHPARLLGDVLTIQATLGSPDTQVRLGLVGTPDSALAQAWRSVAAEGDLDLDVHCLPRPAQGAGLLDSDRHLGGLDLWCDPELPACADGRPALWRVRDAAGTPQRPRSLAQEQQRQHRFLIQALLLRALA